MKIISVKKGLYEDILTDEIEYLNRYRRIEPMKWQHWLGETHQWLEIRFCDLLEEAYKEWERKLHALESKQADTWQRKSK